jgi:hypothetical protein
MSSCPSSFCLACSKSSSISGTVCVCVDSWVNSVQNTRVVRASNTVSSHGLAGGCGVGFIQVKSIFDSVHSGLMANGAVSRQAELRTIC